jgi:hypothetical protein
MLRRQTDLVDAVVDVSTIMQVHSWWCCECMHVCVVVVVVVVFFKHTGKHRWNLSLTTINKFVLPFNCTVSVIAFYYESH